MGYFGVLGGSSGLLWDTRRYLGLFFGILGYFLGIWRYLAVIVGTFGCLGVFGVTLGDLGES